MTIMQGFGFSASSKWELAIISRPHIPSKDVSVNINDSVFK